MTEWELRLERFQERVHDLRWELSLRRFKDKVDAIEDKVEGTLREMTGNPSYDCYADLSAAVGDLIVCWPP